MKKLAFLATSIGFFVNNAVAFAQDATDREVNFRINPTQINQGVSPFATPGAVLTNALTIVFVIAAIVVLFFLVLGAFQWITSGGDKEKVAKARGTIVNALIGLALLALAFFLTRVVGLLVNIDVFNLGTVPTLNSGVVPQE